MMEQLGNDNNYETERNVTNVEPVRARECEQISKCMYERIKEIIAYNK
jgi:hypothetical protein